MPSDLAPMTVRLATLALIGAAAASITIVAWPGSFPSPDPGAVDTVLAEARGWSAITLALAVPLGGLALARRGSLRGRLLLAGVLGYLVYTFLEFAVSPPFSALYLVYIATWAAALPALVGTLATLDLAVVADAFGARAPRLPVALFGFAFAAVLGLGWLRGIVDDTLAGAFGYPQGAAAVSHVVHALDLGMQVPLGLATGWLLLRREPAGFVVASLAMVMAGLMALSLVAMVGVASLTAGEPLIGVAPFVVVAAIAVALAVAWFRAPTEEVGGAVA